MCLKNNMTKNFKQKMIRSEKHKICTIEQYKKYLNQFDDERCIFKKLTYTLRRRYKEIILLLFIKF